MTAHGAPLKQGGEQRGPLLLACNHIGYLDVIVLASVSPALFVSKDDLARWPVLGPLARSVGTLFLDRNRPRAVAEVGEGMRRIFAADEAVILFPEGTTTHGDTVGPFHTALFEIGGNHEAERLFKRGWDTIVALRLRFGYSRERLDTAALEFRQLADALRRQYAREAEAVIRMHNRAGMEDLLEKIAHSKLFPETN